MEREVTLSWVTEADPHWGRFWPREEGIECNEQGAEPLSTL